MNKPAPEQTSFSTDDVLRLRLVSSFDRPARIDPYADVEVTKETFQLAQTELFHARETLSDMVENATVAMHWVGVDGRIIWANRFEMAMLGYARDEYIGCEIAKFHADANVIDDILRKLKSGKTLEEYPARLLHKDGSIRHVLINSSVFWKDGEFAHTRCFTRDVTEQKRTLEALKEREAQLEAELSDTKLLQAVSAEIAQESDLDALYRNFVGAAVKIMRSDFASMQMFHATRGQRGELQLLAFHGFDPDSAKFWEWVRADSGCTCGQVLKTGSRAIATDVETCDFMAGTPDREALLKAGMLSAQSTPLLSRSGKLVGMISTHWKHRHTPALRDLRLLDILARQAADLIERRQSELALRDADRRKDEFLAMLAHELRNPLAPIVNAAQILKRGQNEDPKQQQARLIIDRQAAHLTRLVDDLLEVSRITSGRIQLQKTYTTLQEVIERATETVRPLIDKNQHSFHVSLPQQPTWLHGDAVRLEQIVVNLLNNAVKYTDNSGSISVDVVVDENCALLNVVDTGIGIEPEILPSIFELFTQAERSLDRSRGGLGIGLSLVKRLVELHDGSVGVESKIGEGSRFWVKLPLAGPTQDMSPAHTAQV